ncbi:MAG: hypothetical protein FD166_1153 [Bacteroidetes bacterium]|nr:MAG: hypothetical protein FD166_1153 [Bacteroidota bacterium]
MSIIEILRLLRKHMVLLIMTPLLMALLVGYLTRKPVLVYSSETTLYTGIASGSSVEMDKSLSFFATNTAFDNLINVIKSRETQQEVAIRLLAQHLLLEKYDDKYISRSSYSALRKITPQHIELLIIRDKLQGDGNKANKSVRNTPSSGSATQGSISNTDNVVSGDSTGRDTVKADENFSFSSLDTASNNGMQPLSINREAFELTVQNLKAYMALSDTNFVYKLLYFNHPHYSFNALSKIKVQRIGTSDLVKLNYESDDPGICQQTLVLLTEVCIKNYKGIKENRSDAVVKYFEYQVKQAAARLQVSENRLLKFNEEHNIINYYEQSKAVAIVKEDLEVSYHNMRIKLAGTKAALKRIEDKLGNQQQIQLNNAAIIEKRNQLGEINSRIATIETVSGSDSLNNQSLVILKAKADKLKDDMRVIVNNLYNYGHTTEGLPINSLLSDWLKNVIEYEDTKAGLEVLGDRITDFQKQYAVYAPAGANIKRIEREISVSEQEFLELLHGLNLAKLKLQDAELSSSIKAVDQPFFPLSPNPTKRKLLVIVAAVFGFIILLGTILAMEFFDKTLKNPRRASKFLKFKLVGIFPKVFLKTGTLNFPFVANRLLEILVQNLELIPKVTINPNEPRTIVFFSTLSREGKSVLMGNIALKLKSLGKRVLVLNYSDDTLLRSETSLASHTESLPVNTSNVKMNRHPLSFISRLLGYSDTSVDYNSPFLSDPESILHEEEYISYDINSGYYSSVSYKDLIPAEKLKIPVPDVVMIEIPDLLSSAYPAELIRSASVSILVCRANHQWTEADQGALEGFMQCTSSEPHYLINGVDLQAVESVLGDLPKKRSWLRRFFKRLVRFQFFTGYQP